MSVVNLKRNTILLLCATILSIGIFRYHGAQNVSFCINTAGCTWQETVDGQKRIGNVMVKDFGFPMVYRHTEEFTYNNPPNPHQHGDTGTTTAKTERPSFSLPSIVINIVFWFALLHLLSRFIPLFPKSKTEHMAGASADVSDSR